MGVFMNIDNPVFSAALNIMQQIRENIKKTDIQVDAYIAGGMAVSYWVGEERISYDVDAILSHRIVLPNLSSELEINGKTRNVIFNHNFNHSFFLKQENYRNRATEVAIYDNFHVHVLAPVDLAIMKASRFVKRDIDDIELLIKNKLIDKIEFEYLVEYALKSDISDHAPLLENLEIINGIFDKYQYEYPKSGFPRC